MGYAMRKKETQCKRDCKTAIDTTCPRCANIGLFEKRITEFMVANTKYKQRIKEYKEKIKQYQIVLDLNGIR